MDILKIAVICLVAAVMAKVIQPTNRDLAALLSISAVIFSAFIAVDGITQVFSGMDSVFSGTGLGSGYLKLAFRALGICYISELCSSSCRDCGETALGSILDISGRVAVALICLPLLREFTEAVKSVLER